MNADERMAVWKARIALIRARVLAELDAVRPMVLDALQPDRPNRFTWFGREYWVDTVRHMVVPALHAERCIDARTLPDDDEMSEAYDMLEVHAGEYRMMPAGNFIRVFSHFFFANPHGLDPYHADVALLNLAIVEPTVNPAFGPLFWLVLASETGPAGDRENVYDVIRPMTFDAWNATPVRDAAKARAAQSAFVQTLPSPPDVTGAELLDDEAWARRCQAELDARADWLEGTIYQNVWAQISIVAHQRGLPMPI